MLFTPHTLIGGAIGAEVNNVPLAFVLGFISHFILDFIPHFDTTDNGKFTLRQNLIIGIDLLLGGYLLLHYWSSLDYSPAFFFGALGAITPDLLDIVPFWNKSFRKTKFGLFFHNYHERIQKVKVGPVLGILTQLVVLLIALFMLK